MSCPNINSPEWKALVGAIGVREAYREFAKYGNIPDVGAYPQTFAGVNATLKVVGALNTAKMQQVYTKFYGNNKDKFYAELTNNGATKEQVQLLRQWNEHNNPSSLSDMIAGIAAGMSYTVEINEAMAKRSDRDSMMGGNDYGDEATALAMDEVDALGTYQHDSQEYWDEVSRRTTRILQRDAPFTSHYARLTVPGGTNYRENEIRTPGITPSIQGHAAFSTDKGIGWFRSDDVQNANPLSPIDLDKNPDAEFAVPSNDIWKGMTRTRRILEVQSDLFQKGRNRENLIASPAFESNENTARISVEDLKSIESELSTTNGNSFLQLLNKDNNWITFFVKSIIQDSTRKGYEEVLFPAGNTANKVEGQETLDQFVSGRMQMITEAKEKYKRIEVGHWTLRANDDSGARGTYESKEEAEGHLNDSKYIGENFHVHHQIATKEELVHAKATVDRFETELNDALAGKAKFQVINKFYETTIQNILSKQQFGPQRITDEHGNDWFKVTLGDRQSEDTIFYNREFTSPRIMERDSLAFLKDKGLIDENNNIVATEDTTLSEAHEIIGINNAEYYEKYGFNLYNVDGNKVSVNTQGTVFAKDNETVAQTVKGTMNILNKLQQNTGVPYQIITDEESQGLLGDFYLDSIKGFYKEGKVYLLDSGMTESTAFHEYAHPFVSALKLHNGHLYSQLIASLKASPEIEGILKHLDKYYPELASSFDTGDLKKWGMYNDEIIVRAMTAVATGQLTFESTDGMGFWSKLWFGLKQMFRDIFGQKVDLSKLSTDTNLSELVNMLLTEKVDLSHIHEDYALFNRDIAEELEDIDNHQAIKSIETFHRVAQDHLVKLRENKNYAELREVLKNQADGSILNDLNKLLTLSKQKEEEIDNNRKQLLNFSRAIVGARTISEKMKTHVQEMNAKEMDEKDKLRIMRYYSFISNDWLQAFEQLRGINKDDLPFLGADIQKATNNFQRINDHVAQAFKGGLVKTFMESFAPINENIEKELKPEMDKVQKLVDAGDKSLQNRLDYLKKMYEHGTFDEDKTLKLLQGELGDTNFFSSLFESYTSSPDPIVGGFAAYVNKELYKVEANIQEFSTNLGNQLAPLYKEYGVNVSKPEELGQQLVFKDTAFSKDENGEVKGHEVYSLLHEFGNGYQFDYQRLQHAIDDAKEGGNKEEAIKLQKEFDQLKKDYFHREYVDEVYKAKDFWDESDINRLARQRRKDITDQLAGYEAEASMSDKGLTSDDLEHMDQLLRQLKTLSSTKNLDGTDKVGDDLGVAQAIQEYNKRMMQYREEMAMKGAFERELQTAKDDLLDKGYGEGSLEYNQGLNNWLKANLRVRLSDQFYSDRDRITDAIAAIVNKLPQDEAKKLDVSKAWKEMFEQIKGFRDQDNQPVGSALSESKLHHVHELQEKINDMTDELRRVSGLTGEESERYSELWGKLKAGQGLDPQESGEFKELNDRKEINGLGKEDKAQLMSLFEQLKEFQSKVPTEYYIEAFNQKLNESGMQESMSYDTADAFLNDLGMIQHMASEPNSPISKWFNQNHIMRVKFNPQSGQHEEMYERLYVWNRIIPNDATFKQALATNDYQALLAIKNPYVQVKPAAKYFFYRIKNEFRTKREVGKTIDNKGNWLPKTLVQGAKDGKYANKQYQDLKGSSDPKQKALYKILETYKKAHLQTQEDAPRYARLWYELPRVRKEKVENIQAAMDDPMRTGKNLVSWIGSKVGKNKVDAFDTDMATKKDLHNEQKMYVATDLFGNEINSIPMKYMSKLDTDLVSLDVGRSITKYALALQINKTLHDINPFAQALQQTLAEEGIKSINKMSTRNWTNKFSNIPVLDRSNNRLKTINNMVERDIEGVENKMELGLIGSKVAQHLMGVAAFGSLALNLPAGIKNVVVAKLQNLTEAVSKEFFSAKNLKDADQIFMKRFMPKLIHDYNKFAGRSLETQMFELFDFVQGKFEEHAGESFSASFKKDIAKLRFTRSFQVLGELQAQGQAGIAMMLKQQVPWEHEGKTTMINYLDAWELKNGAIQLKDGVDKSWGKTGNNFAAFKLKMHKINELMQGAYSKMNQAEASRYTSYKLFNFMRRYLVPGLANRFTVNRNNFALGTQREGYYMTTMRMAKELARDGIKNWAHYSDKEKRNVFKTLTEMGYSFALMALISMMGYSSDDPDKNKKLKNNSWAFNMALYEIVMIKGELENFIPVPGMGLNEILRMKDQPSIAFPILNKYYKIISHLMDLVQQPFTDYDITHYRRGTGIYSKGDLKIWSDILKAIGYTGATMHPDVAVKNYMATTNRYQ